MRRALVVENQTEISRSIRIIRIITALQSGEELSVDDLARMLSLSRRTIFRDLRSLRDIGIPCSCNPKTGTYSIDKGFFLAPIDFTFSEAVGVLLILRELSAQIPTPFHEAIRSASMKIKSTLPAALRQSCHSTLSGISVRSQAVQSNPSEEGRFLDLQTAIVHRRMVRMRYGAGASIPEILLYPYHLFFDKTTWYVIGRAAYSGRIETIRLDGIHHMTVLDRCYTEEIPFNLDAYVGNAWSIRPEGKLYPVRLRFSPVVARNVCSVQWHKTQKVRMETDGHAILEFLVDGLNEIVWWIVGYADQVQVLSPEILRHRVLRIHRNAEDLHSSGAPDSTQCQPVG